MINSISGTITGKFPQKIFIDNNGIEWEIIVPDTALDKLPNIGENARVYTWLQHTDSAMTLFGFATTQDRDLFFDLNKVDGVGPKSAVKIMSSIAREQLIAALDSGNLATLEKILGLGKKTAAKMLLALKGKLTLDETETVTKSTKKLGEFEDVISGLVTMGYDRKKVESVISKVAEESKGKLESLSQKEKEDILFRKALMELAM